jgi:hypothetical protein
VTDPDSPEEDFDSSPEEEEEEDSPEEEDGNDDGEDDNDTDEEDGDENFKCHDYDNNNNNAYSNDNDDILHSTMMWHHVPQEQAGHEIDCESFSSNSSSEEEANEEEEFGDDDDDAEEGIELEEDEHQDDEGDLSDSSGDDGTDELHDDDDDDEYGSSQEYETDEDSLDDVNECDDPTMVDDVDHDNDDDDGAFSIASSLFGPRPNRILGNGATRLQQQHELFLPMETAPTIESLKYEEDDDDESNCSNESSSDEDVNDDDDDDDEDDDTQVIYEQNNRNSGRPRLWYGSSYNAVKPPLPSISSSLSRSSVTSKKCRHKSKESSTITSSNTCRHHHRRSGVTFNESVTVYPIFKTSAYTPTMILAMYTQRDELRINKLRNKREYAYEDYDWRNVVEENDMTDGPSTTGCAAEQQLVHPVHATSTTNATIKDKTVKSSSSSNSRSPSPRNVIQTYSSAFGGYINVNSNTSLHGAKRMRMYYP